MIRKPFLIVKEFLGELLWSCWPCFYINPLRNTLLIIKWTKISWNLIYYNVSITLLFYVNQIYIFWTKIRHEKIRNLRVSFLSWNRRPTHKIKSIEPRKYLTIPHISCKSVKICMKECPKNRQKSISKYKALNSIWTNSVSWINLALT